MKFTAALFAVGALAVVRRQGSLGTDIAAITTATNSLTSAIEAYTGDIQQALAVNSANGDVLTAIQAAQTTAEGLTSIDDPISLLGPIGALNTAVESSINALIAKQSTFDSAGLGGAVLQNLQTQAAASQKLTDTVVSKLPEGLQEAGRNASQPAADAVAKGIAAFSSSSGGGSSSSAAASASTSAPVYPTGAMSSSAAATGSVTGAPVYSTMSMGSMPSATQSMPVQYTGAAAKQVVGLGALAMGALVAAL